MNKKLKVFLLVALVVIVAGASFLLYEFKFKTYDVADDAVDEIIEEPYKLELPDGTPIEQKGSETGDKTDGSEESSSSGSADASAGSGDTAAVGGTTTDKTGKITVSKNVGGSSSNAQSSASAGKGQSSQSGQTGASGQSGQNNSNSGNTASKPQTGGDISVASIKAKYKPTLQGLEDQAAGRLNSLVGRAKSEYAEKNKAGGVSYGYFYNKYMGAAKSMEAQTDGAFNSVMNALENELKANGYDKSYAKSFRNDYEARKKSLRTELMNKALGR